jgi:hypothetical protein
VAEERRSATGRMVEDLDYRELNWMEDLKNSRLEYLEANVLI